MGRVALIFCGAAFGAAALTATGADAEPAQVTSVRIAVLSQTEDRPPALSNLEIPPADGGILGARLAINDNNTTGRFMRQRFELGERIVGPRGDAVAAFKQLAGEGYRFIVVNLRPEVLIEIADLAEAKETLIFNAGAPDDDLRNAQCRANILHTTPSRAMKADALGQYLVWKRWRKWLLVIGRRANDRLFANAMKRAAKRFGAKVVAQREWKFGADARRMAQAEVPVFTQGIDYDVLIVADEIGEFGEYLIYRTWKPNLVAGTQGLVATAWHRVHEQWGAVQFQNRFLRSFKRRMRPLDYAMWVAVRSIGEAATRTRSADFKEIAAYLRSEKFTLAGFKGQKLTFRAWNGQLRQPILLAAAKALVSVSPQQGFLHRRSLLDTLGYDAPESKCRLGR